MKTIKVNNDDYARLEWLAAHWFVCEGNKPCPVMKVIHNIIDREWLIANPPKYQTTGFERLE